MNSKESGRTPLDRFGELLIRGFRDKAIEQNEMLLNGKLRGKVAQKLYSKLKAFSSDDKELIRNMVVDLVDVGLHDMLFAFQEAHDLGFGVEILVDGQNIAEQSGMLQGEPLGPNGWVAKFSKYPKGDD